MADKDDTPFMPIPFRRRAFLPVSANQYHVIEGSGESKKIEANTAYEAFKLSGYSQAIKIERVSNLFKTIFENKEFKEEINVDKAADSASGATVANPFAAHHKCVFSADEMDAMIRSLQSHAVRAQDTSVAVPAPSAAPSPGFVAGPTGVDVHGDGFDEIIPSAPAAKPAAAPKPQETKEPAKAEAPAVPSVPQQELSPDDVEKLLGGNSRSKIRRVKIQ